MVQCDKCDSWWHYSCAEVSETIKEKEFVCKQCSCRKVRSRSSKSSNSSTRSRIALIELELKRLEEEKALADRLDKEREEIEKKAREDEKARFAQKKAREEAFMKKKYELMQEVMIETDDRISEDSRSVQSSKKKVEQWISHLKQDTATSIREKPSQSVVTSANPIVTNSGVITTVSTGAIPKIQSPITNFPSVNMQLLNPFSDQHNVNQSSVHGKVITNSVPNDLALVPYPTRSHMDFVNRFAAFTINSATQRRQPNESKTVVSNENHNEAAIPLGEIPRHVDAAGHHGNISVPNQPEHVTSQTTAVDGQRITGPTAQQLAARHVVPKELPTFSGNPSEWPLFISAYLNSTELCGFSDGENLMRLQRCLKGNALESVRSYLLLPSSVSIILSNVRTVERLELPVQSLDFSSLVNRHQYLDGLPIKSYNKATPRVLIGIDNIMLTLNLKKREGRRNEPVAAKTRLGWSVFGNINEGTGQYSSLHACECQRDHELHKLVQDFFELESLGICKNLVPTSKEDERAARILQETTKRTPMGRFETGLLWKQDSIEFPNSYPMAWRRLCCLEKKLQLAPVLYENVRKQMVDYQLKGYAHKATEVELRAADQHRVWYLPLGVVTSPRKPGKVRVIWDAAAKVNGVSFNSMMMKGPDLLKPLLGVLCRFRQRQFAITGDLKEMFHQILIRPQDRQSQRFLWRDNPDVALEIYVMDVATFGSSCSPCTAQYVKNINAKEFENEFSEAADAIIHNHYVDDYLDSRDTEDEIIKLALDVKKIHSRAGFEIRNWLSNSNIVLSRVGEPQSDTLKTFAIDKCKETERVLGLIWLPHEDVLSFDIKFREDLMPLVKGKKIPTKRQVLQVVMSVYDPLGMVSTFLIHGKILIQNIWRTKIGWDDLIPGALLEEWNRWIELIAQLPMIKIDRCYFPDYNPKLYDSVELHIFVDASEFAYCCAAYFKIMQNAIGRCALVSSKAKVAPLKPLSVPRMELQAAVMGVRMAKAVQENHTLKILRRYFWTDSSTVLAVRIRC